MVGEVRCVASTNPKWVRLICRLQREAVLTCHNLTSMALTAFFASVLVFGRFPSPITVVV